MSVDSPAYTVRVSTFANEVTACEEAEREHRLSGLRLSHHKNAAKVRAGEERDEIGRAPAVDGLRSARTPAPRPDARRRQRSTRGFVSRRRTPGTA
jgi:hypothetical protein